MNRSIRLRGVALAAVLSGGLAQAQLTERVSVDSSGAEGNGTSSGFAQLSANGRFVAFRSSATNLVAGDANGYDDVFLRDRFLGTTECISVDPAGAVVGNDHSALFGLAVSGDGRCVAFQSAATNMIPADTNGVRDIFLRDRVTGITEMITVDSFGVQGDYHSRYPSISDDGRFVAFGSASANLVPGDLNNVVDVFLRDRLLGTTERISIDTVGNEANQQSLFSSVSADGRFVVFDSTATNLVSGDSNGVKDIFVRDRQLGTTERVSVGPVGVQGTLESANPWISADGRFVAFDSAAPNLVAGDANGYKDVFVRDLVSAATEIVSLSSGGTQGANNSTFPSISANGRFVAFDSAAANLVAGDTNAFRDCFVRDRQNATTERVSVSTSGTQGDSISWYPSISANGGKVGFWSIATNLVAGDTNGVYDVFVHESGSASPGTDLCQPGVGAVMACPCTNPPANAPRGCDNSSATGGAQLVSTGSASLSSDSVVFVTNGERPTATSILLQGNLEVSAGTTFGQGVRCVGGTLKRLYVKTASGGSITAPGPGDLSVSARSAQLNHVILPGTSRWYAVYYRDPGVLGGCSAGSTFNITQTQLVNWGA